MNIDANKENNRLITQAFRKNVKDACCGFPGKRSFWLTKNKYHPIGSRAGITLKKDLNEIGERMRERERERD